MKNILKQHKNDIYLVTLDNNNKIKIVNNQKCITKLKELNMVDALLTCIQVDKIKIDFCIVDNDKKQISDFLTPDIEDNYNEVKKSTVKSNINHCNNQNSKESIKTINNVKNISNKHLKTSILPNYQQIKTFVLNRFNELKESNCKVFNIIQDEVLKNFYYDCSLAELKNFCLNN